MSYRDCIDCKWYKDKSCEEYFYDDKNAQQRTRNEKQIKIKNVCGNYEMSESLKELSITMNLNELTEKEDLILEESKENLTHIGELVIKSYENIENRYNNRDETSGISSGFYDLDCLTAGFQPCDLIVVASRPSMGKTSFCLNIAQEAGIRKKKAIAIFCSEMSKEQLITRILCSESEIDSNRIRTGHMHAEDWIKIAKSMSDTGDCPIFIDNTPNISPKHIKIKINALVEEGNKPELVIIDPLQLIKTGNKSNPNNHYDRTIEIYEIMSELKALAMEHKIPIILTAQVSKTVETRLNKRPCLSDLSESDYIAQIADIVMFIHREEYYESDNIDKKGKAEVIVAKHRNGPIGSIELLFQGSITSFKNPVSKRVNVF